MIIHDVMHALVLYKAQSECGIECNCASAVLVFA